MIIAFVPVRSGSKSIPHKNIKHLCGKPLVYWVLQALHGVSDIEKIFVATDGEEIKKTVNDFGFAKVEVYDRAPENATDIASTESVMLEFVHKMSFDEHDHFILAQATSPFTQTKDIENAIRLYRESGADSLVSCARIKRFFWDENGTPVNYDHRARPRRQDFLGTLTENGAFYMHTIKGIKQYKNRLGGKIIPYEMPEYTLTEIDEPVDWIVAEHLLQEHVLKNSYENKSEKFF